MGRNSQRVQVSTRKRSKGLLIYRVFRFTYLRNQSRVLTDPHSHIGVLSQSADAQNSPPLYYTIIFRY